MKNHDVYHVCGSRMHVWGVTYSCLMCDRAWLEAHRVPVLITQLMMEGRSVGDALLEVSDRLCLSESVTKQQWQTWRKQHGTETGGSGVLVESS